MDSPIALRLVAILENTTNSLRVKLTYFLLRLAGAALLPLLLLYAAWRCLRQPAYYSGMKERLGFLSSNIPSTKPGGIWLHAVSVGEVLSAIALLKKLREVVPETPVFVSVTTLAGRELAEKRLTGLCDGVFFAPVDFVFAVRMVLRRIAPALVVNFETEIWPQRIREVKRSGAKWAQVNARVSDRAWPSYLRLRRLFEAVMPQMDLVVAQSEVDAGRFRELGYDKEIQLLGNLKFDFDPAAKPVAADLVAWMEGAAKPVWIAASTTGGSVDEDDAVLDAYEKLEGRIRLVIAPRKPERFEVVAGKLAERGIRFARRTGMRSAEVLLLDSIGELAGLFALGDVVFVGGSFNETQGHNILEPAYFGKPILTGPNMRNFAEIQAAFLRGDAVRVVPKAGDLAGAVMVVLGDVALGERAREIAAEMRGVADRICPLLVELLGAGVPKGMLPLSTLLMPLSMPWVWVSQRRVVAKRLPVRVISVGNLSMGGTGKTPLVIALGKSLAADGKRVGILTRGYGRRSSKSLVLGIGQTASRFETGDEVQLFLRENRFVVGIGGDRYRVGQELLEKWPVDVLLLDDGFQHRQLARDLDVVCVDALRPFPGYGVPPCGLLREPMSALRRADVFVVTRGRKGVSIAGLKREIGAGERPVIVAETREWMPELPQGRRVAFCGLGNPGSFRQSLDRMGLREVELMVFPDHHEYGAEDLEKLRQKGEVWITTAKDAVKVEGAYVVKQEMVLGKLFETIVKDIEY